MDQLPTLVFCDILCEYVCQHEKCCCVVQKHVLKQHLSRKHRINVKRAVLEAKRLLQFAEGKIPDNIATRYFKDPFPRNGEHPLPALSLLPVYDVMQCPCCKLYFNGVRACKSHIRSSHSVNCLQENFLQELDKSTSVKGQALFLGPARFFFPVSCPGPSGAVEDSLILSSSADKIQEETTISDDLSIRERSANLTCSVLGIPEFLSMQNLTMEEAYQLSTAERGMNSKIVNVLLSYISHFHEMQPPVPLALVEGVRIRNGNNVASFSLSLHHKSKKRYAWVAARFILLVGNLGSVSLPSFSLSDALKRKCQEVLGMLQEKGSVSLQHIHEFFRELLLEEPRASIGEAVMIESLFKLLIAGYTCAVQSKRIRVGDAADASHTAASMQYFTHIAALGEFLVSPRGFSVQKNEDDGTRLRGIQEKLSTAKCTPAAYLRIVLHKTKQLSAGESPRIEFVPCPNHELCGTIENIEVQVNSDQPGSIGFAVRSIQTDVMRIMRNRLMRDFKIPADFIHKVLRFQDKLSDRDPGYFFGEGEEAKRVTREWSEALARHLSNGTEPLIVSVTDVTGQNGKWSPTRHVAGWLKTVDELSVLLYTLVHLCGGGPPRVTEMIDAKIRNTAGSKRNLFIIKQRLALIVSYTKTARQSEKPMPIARFLDEITSEILLLFVVFIKPIQCFFLRHSTLEMRATKDYLFCQSGEKIAEGIVRREFSKALSSKGLPLNVSLYRQLRTGVGKAFLAEKLSPTNEKLMFGQAGHAESTARIRYAGGDFGIGDLTLPKLEGFYEISRRWHEVLGLLQPSGNRCQNQLGAKKARVGGQKTSLSAFQMELGPLSSINLSAKRSISKQRSIPCGKRLKQNESGERVAINGQQSTTESILSCARDILGLSRGQEVKFKSAAQRAATFDCCLQTIVAGYDSTMIVILPTGGGKTLCWTTAALREQRQSDMEKSQPQITLLIVPLISLQQDMLRKCRSYGLRCETWSGRFTEGASVVICSIDVVSTNEYNRFVAALSVQQRLARFVLDEAHLVLLWEEFRRFEFLGSHLRPGQAKCCPLVCLTATLPNEMILELQRVLKIDGSCVKLYREFNSRVNISYQVQRVHAVRSEEMVAQCNLILKREMEGMKRTERAIVFCLTMRDCVMLHEVVTKHPAGNQACIYHGSMDHAEREASFNAWSDVNSAKPIAMIATSAFSCGIDFPHVRLVLHAGGSRTIVELAQESGRAGRDGALSKNVVLFNQQYIGERTDKPCLSGRERGEEHSFGDVMKILNQDGNCRRQVIENFLNDSLRGPCNGSEVKCDVCEKWRLSENAEKVFHERTYGNLNGQPSKARIVINRKPVEACRGNCTSEGSTTAAVCEVPPRHESMPFPMKKQLQGYGQPHRGSTNWYAMQISLAKCAVCLFNRNIRESHETCMRGRCFRCMEPRASHQSKECEVTPRGRGGLKRCFFCGIPRNKGLHRNGSFDCGGRCEWQVVKNLGLLMWRDIGERLELVEQIPQLRSARNIRGVGELLCGGHREQEQCLLARIVDFMYARYVLCST